MSKLYIYRGKNDQVTIYYDKEFPESKGIPVFEYDGEIPSGVGALKTNGEILYLEPIPTPTESEPTTDDIINALLGVTK